MDVLVRTSLWDIDQDILDIQDIHTSRTDIQTSAPRTPCSVKINDEVACKTLETTHTKSIIEKFFRNAKPQRQMKPSATGPSL